MCWHSSRGDHGAAEMLLNQRSDSTIWRLDRLRIRFEAGSRWGKREKKKEGKKEERKKGELGERTRKRPGLRGHVHHGGRGKMARGKKRGEGEKAATGFDPLVFVYLL